MSKNEFNDATLKYLTNKNYNVVQVNEINHSEIKFYRKRIIDITKKILHNKIEIDNNIKDVYYDYVNVLIEHFKTSDKHRGLAFKTPHKARYSVKFVGKVIE